MSQQPTQLQPPPLKQQQSQQPIFIRQLPPYYPEYLQQLNLNLGKQIPQIAKAANFLDVPPLFLCIISALILIVLVFAKFIVNFIIILALLVSSIYNCLYITAVLDHVVFSQILNLTASLVFLALYIIFSPILDMCLDWVPFYHPSKLFIAFALTYHSYPSKVNADGTVSHDNNPFPLVSVDGSLPNNSQLGSEQQSAPIPLHRVPELPPTVKAGIDVIQSLILLSRGHVIRRFRLNVWALRTWAYDLKVNYSAQENILEDVDFDLELSTDNKKDIINNKDTGLDIDLNLDDLSEDDGFTLLPDVNNAGYHNE